MNGLQSNRSFNQASVGELGNDRRANSHMHIGDIVSSSFKRLLTTASFVFFGLAAEVHAQNYPGFDALNAAIAAYAADPSETNKQAVEAAKTQLRGDIRDDSATETVSNPTAPDRAPEEIVGGYKSIYVTDTGRAAWIGINNSAVVVGSGDGFYITSATDPQDDAYSVQFKNNIRPMNNGGAIGNRGRLFLDRTKIEGNSGVVGGAIYNVGTATITDASFDGNAAQEHGGAIYNEGTATITDASFEGNTAQYGGAIYTSTTATATITGGRFEGNTAQYGGAILSGSTATITDASFEGNAAGMHGGAIYNVGTATITAGTSFEGNTAQQYGGAIYNISTATITDASFEGNTAQGHGGAIFNAGIATITDASFEGNTAQQYGGAIYNIGTATITDASFEGNTAQGHGGAIFNASIATITNGRFEGNTAQENGGAIYNQGYAAITATSFESNTAKGFGGAIYNYYGTATITGVSFDGNAAQEYGGAIYNNYGTATITNASFEGNTAKSGGAIANDHRAEIKDSQFVGNIAGTNGGAIFLDYGSNSTLQVTDVNKRSLFSGNLADNKPNSIHFDVASGAITSLDIDVADGGLLDMRDPMSAGVVGRSGTSSTITITKNGLGAWRLGGTSNLIFDQSQAHIDFRVNGGSLYLYGAGEVANANVNDANAKVEAGVVAIKRDTAGSGNSLFTLGAGGTLVAAGENRIDVDGTITLADGATIRGGTASDRDEGHTLTALGGATSLELKASDGVLVAGALNVAAVEERDTFRLNAALQGAPGADANIVKTGAGTLILNGNASYAGKIDVQAGKLSIEDPLGVSQLDIRAGATLAGNGTIGQSLGAAIMVASGGTLAPGNSIGRLDVDGNLSLLSGSIYAVEIAGSGANDLTHVLGTASIADGSIIKVSGLDPKASYQNGQTYVVLSSANPVNGAFTQTVSEPAFLEASSATKGNEVIVTLKVKSDPKPAPQPEPQPQPQPQPKPAPDVFTRAANTENQRNVAGGLNTLEQSGQSLALYNKLLLLSEEEARAAFDSLSGEVYASAKTAMLDDGGHIRSSVSSRLRQAFDDSYSHEQGDAGSLSQYGGWANAYGSWSHISSDGNAAGLNSSVGGVVSGADALIGDIARFGLFAGYSHSNFSVPDRNSSGRSDNYTLGAYLATKLQAGQGL